MGVDGSAGRCRHRHFILFLDQGGGGNAGFLLGEQCLPSAGDSRVSHQGREFFFPISQSDEETRNIVSLLIRRAFPDSSAGKESTFNAGNLGSIPGLGRSPGDEKDFPLRYSGLKNSMGSQRVSRD